MPPLRRRLWHGFLQGVLYGAALGMVVGFVWQSGGPTLPPSQAIIEWRTAILSGAAVGGVLGLVLGPRLIKD